MKKDFIRINDQDFRIEINMNSAEEWERLSGMKLGQFEIAAAESAKTGGIATRPMLLWLFCAIREGEELEGRKYEPDFLEFKRLLKPSVMTLFAPIFINQYIGEQTGIKANKEGEEVKKKSRKALSTFRFSGVWPWVKWLGIATLLTFAGLYIFGRH